MKEKKFDEIIQALDDLDDAFKKVTSTMSTGPASWYFERMKEYHRGCTKASKFKVGDRVQLKEDYNGTATGWESKKHILKRGNFATVKAVDYYDGKYRYDIMFDRETWLKPNWDNDSEKFQEVDVSEKHVFGFKQNELERVK